MIDHRSNEIIIVDGLKSYIGVEVVRQNQVAEIPPYPYVSYTVTTPLHSRGGTYSQKEDGTMYRSFLQTWSFTSQSDDQEEALTIALKIYDYFTAVGLLHLADNGITVHNVRDVTTRDNMISIQYEYRNGLDVTFGLLHTITPTSEMSENVIETNIFKEV